MLANSQAVSRVPTISALVFQPDVRVEHRLHRHQHRERDDRGEHQQHRAVGVVRGGMGADHRLVMHLQQVQAGEQEQGRGEVEGDEQALGGSLAPGIGGIMVKRPCGDGRSDDQHRHEGDEPGGRDAVADALCHGLTLARRGRRR